MPNDRRTASRARVPPRNDVSSLATRVLVVDDILTTGGSLRETLAALASHPVDVAGVAVLVDRSGGEVDLGVPYVALATMDIATWDASDCPLCRRGEPSSNPVPPPVTLHG